MFLFPSSTLLSSRRLVICVALLGSLTVQADGSGCTEDPSLYFIDKHYIKCINLTTSNQTYVSIHTLKSDVVQGGAIDIHHQGRMIYWSDIALWTINRMSLDTGETEVIIRDNLGEIYGLAVEWESEKIYFTDFIFERIEVSNLNGSFRKTLVSKRLYSPRGIAVDPKSGYMFWTDYGFDSPRIERADLTGENRKSLVSFGIDWYYAWFPMSVVVDYDTDPERIIWMDRYDNYIDFSDFDGNKAELGRISQNIRPADLALLGDILYWADENSHSIEWFNMTQPVIFHYNFGHLTNDYLAGIVISDKSRQPIAVNHPPCRINNGGCSHLCLLAPGGGSKCACPNGVEFLPGNKTCSNVTKPGPPPPAVPDLKVRLSGSNSSHEGRVEVYYDNKWGTVCDDHWGLREATIICKMLNFSGAFHVGYFGAGNESLPIWMDNVKCRGDEQSIAACRHRGWNKHDCSHKEDAGVVCRNDSIPPTEGPTLAPGPHPELQVRLRSGTTSNQGRVELFLNGTWGTICDDYWGIEEANVICRMLGYSEGAWSTHCCGWYEGNTAPEQIWLDDVHCVGDETSIAACSHGGWGSHNCGHIEDVGVVCMYTPETPPDKQLRLANGVRQDEGRVEIFHDGYWGTVCDDYWDIKDAQVVCRELGYREAIAAPKRALFGEGNGHIWLRNVHCLGNESSIEDCRHAVWNANSYCFHSEDASVICYNETGSLDADDFLLFCESGRTLCHFMPLTHDSPAKVIPLKVTFDYAPAAISYDPKEKQVYWTDDYGNIYRSYLNNGSQEAVVRGVGSPMGIEFDVIGRNVYFTDNSGNNIRVASFDGNYQAILVDVQNPQSIALDSVDGYMYYSSLGDSPLIYQADMDGKNQRLLANLSFVGDDTFVDLVLDKPNNRLFFSDQTNDVIRYINLANMEIHTILSGNLHNPTSLAMLNDTIYWTAEGDGTFSGAIFKAIFKANMANSITAQTMADGFGTPKGIYIYNSTANEITVQSPCHNNGGCSQFCVLRPNGRTCICGAGMKLAEDGITCTVGDVLFVADVHHNELYISQFSDSILVPLPFSNVDSPTGIAFDPFENRVYWTDSTLGIVYRATIDGKNQEIIRSGVTKPMGIDLDLVAGNVYWINSGDRTIEVSKLNGDFWKVLVSDLASSPVDITLDTTKGFMYWSAEGVIERAELDGSNRRKVTELGVTFYGASIDAKGLTLDVDNNRLYFVSYHLYSLLYIDLSSTQLHLRPVYTLIKQFWYFYGPFGIAVDDQYVYWSEYLIYGYVFRRSKNVHDGDVEVVVSGTYEPKGIAVKKGNFTRNNHSCADSCSHLCLLKPGGYKCACSVNESAIPCTESTNVTNVFGCTDDPSLYFIDEHYIKCIDLKASNQTHVSVKTLKSDLVQGGAIDVHHRGRMIYWSDNALWTINRMSLVTGESEVIIRDYLGEIYGVAVEWESEKIYFTDFIFERIEVANLDGTSRKTLIKKDLFSPHGMTVDSKSGYMFWTDIGFDSPRIERADLTGENRMSLVSFGIDWYYAFFPMSVVVDYDNDPDRIIWMDRYDNYIDYADLNGTNKNNLGYIGQNIRPVDLALYGDILYWADRNSRSIQWFNTTQSTGLHLNYGHLTDGQLAGVVVSDESRQPVATTGCGKNNGGCSHLCLLAPGGGSKCACPNGVELLPGNKTCSNVTKPQPPPTPVPDLKVRLSGSSFSHEGRVEVYYDHKWGTVCLDHWGLEEADVVCKMLNFSGAFYTGYFGAGNESFPIWMDNVKCFGNEQTIAACHHRGWGIHDCSHVLDAGVVCRNDSIPPTEGPTLAPGPHPELKVRLRSGTTSNQGRVELFLNGTWGTICDDNWGIQEANVICRMLGYSEGAWSTHCCGWYEGYTAPEQIWLDDVHCDGDETSIAACRHGGWGSHNCGHSEDVGVVCKFTPETTSGQKLRLADGVRKGEGRVEIFHDGYWGTVCDDYWDIKDAQVVCRELGYPEAIAAPKDALFGEGNGHIWLSDVHCLGNESSIEDCEHAEWNANGYCYHYEDASVICSNYTGSFDAVDFVIFCESGRRLCHFMPLAHDSPAKIIPMKVTFDYAPVAISYDPKEKQIYWTDDYGTVYRAFLNNGSQEALVRGVSSPMGIEVDVIGRNVYFTDNSGNNIRVASLDGHYQATLVDVQNPQSITLDSVDGYMYYSSLGDSPLIYRADMDGKNQRLLANLSFAGDDTFVDLALDKPNNRLFFSDQANDVIRYINLANMEIHTILSGNLHNPTSLAMLNDTIYWTAEGDGTFSGAIFKANLTASSVTAQTMADGFGKPKGIHVYSMEAEITVQSACQFNGGCSQFCILKPNGRTCKCGVGRTLSEDGTSCIVDDVIFVADVDHDEVYMSPLNGEILVSLPFSNIESPMGVAFDPFEERVYWTDYTLGVVYRSTVDGMNQEIIRSNVTAPRGIDLDLVAGNVYWINSDDRTIEVSDMNGDYWKVLVYNLSSAPVDIALDTARGVMYWSAEGVIERAVLDGSNRRIIAELGVTIYGETIDARGLTLDKAMNRIYFVSFYEFSLFYIDLDSAHYTVQTLIQSYWLFYLPYGIAVDEDYVYWTEHYAYGYVFRLNKSANDSFVEAVIKGTYDPRGIAVKKGKFTRDTVHPCISGTSGCTHLCLKIPSGYKCDCPTVTEDAQNCSVSYVTWPPPPTTPTQPPTTTSTTEAPTTVPPNYCASNPCENGAACKSITGSFSCECKVYFVGRTCALNYETEVVQLTLNITLEKYNETVLIFVIVESLNKECESNKDKPECSTVESLESIVKRAAVEGPFKLEDIKLPTKPVEVDGGIQVEYAVVRTAADGRPVAVPSRFVADVTEAKAAEIGEKLGGKVLSVRQKPVGVATTAPQTSGPSGGLIAGVVVAVLLIVIIAAIAVWYFRVKRTQSVNIPYVKEEDNQSKTQTTAFENPGYDSTAAAEDYDDLAPVIFAPFEEHTEAGGVSNPIYTEIDMGSMNPDGHAVESTSKNENLAEAAGELPQKVPLGEPEQLKADEVEIVVQKEKDTTVHVDTPDQEEARYESLVSVKSKEAKNDQTEVTVEKEEEARYETLAHPDAGQTVLVLEGNSPSTAESQT